MQQDVIGWGSSKRVHRALLELWPAPRSQPLLEHPSRDSLEAAAVGSRADPHPAAALSVWEPVAVAFSNVEGAHLAAWESSLLRDVGLAAHPHLLHALE